MIKKILILDFGSQYTQLIARRVRELGVYSEVVPYYSWEDQQEDVAGLILSGSPASVEDSDSPRVDMDRILGKYPVLGICYGAQLITHQTGGKVGASSKREYGRANLQTLIEDDLFNKLGEDKQIWMSHGDSIKKVSDNFEILCSTSSIPVAAFRSKKDAFSFPVYGLQFHPEVSHTHCGQEILKNFLRDIIGIESNWTTEAFIDKTIEDVRRMVGTDDVLLGLSGGVDSTVVAALLNKAIGSQLKSFFIDNGLLRKNEYEQVLEAYDRMGLEVQGVDASDQFLDDLKGITDPEKKRKSIGGVFIKVFEKHARSMPNVAWLGQGTIYPDVIESISVHGPSVTIKSHHNVGGLPEDLALKLIEPMRMLFKDEVRIVGAALDIPLEILNRHPFPGPGFGIRILGEVTPDKVKLLQEADDIYIRILRKTGWYEKIWQAGAILLNSKSVGVMGDERTYEYTVALRAVNSLDGMTADWTAIPHEILAEISSEIINKVKGINRVVYDISSKPPATIEWE